MKPTFIFSLARKLSLQASAMQAAVLLIVLATTLTASFAACNSVTGQKAHESAPAANTSRTLPLPAHSQQDVSRMSLGEVSNVDPAADENLELGETGYLPHVFLHNGPPNHEPSYSGGQYSSGPHQSANSYSYGDNQGNNDYAKKASDWSLYDQGAHGLHDKYGDKAWTDAGYQSHANHGKHDSHSNVQNSHGSDQGSGYYSRDRGYGYERQYAFDRVVDSKSHSNNHQQYANSRGLYDQYGAKNDYNFNKGGHEKYGLANKYGHGYRQLGAHDDYAHGHNQAAGHYPSPLYKSNYYSGPQYPQMPSYY